MRNSSLVKWFCAENLTGLKYTPKLGLWSIEQNSKEAGTSRRKARRESEKGHGSRRVNSRQDKVDEGLEILFNGSRGRGASCKG